MFITLDGVQYTRGYSVHYGNMMNVVGDKISTLEEDPYMGDIITITGETTAVLNIHAVLTIVLMILAFFHRGAGGAPLRQFAPLKTFAPP